MRNVFHKSRKLHVYKIQLFPMGNFEKQLKEFFEYVRGSPTANVRCGHLQDRIFGPCQEALNNRFPDRWMWGE